MSMIGDLFVRLGLNSSGFTGGLNQAQRQTSIFSNALSKVGGMIAGAFAVSSIVNFVKGIVATRSEFAKYESVLTNTLGSSEKARKEMQMLQQFASETPFQLTELTESFVKLTNYGLKPNKEELRNYGDLASSVGKGFNQLVEGIADAVTGQFERLKEFGIKASQEGSKVSFVFKNQRTIVENNSEAIKNYIQGLGKLQGVTGAMAAISGTLGGRISNLGDAWDSFLNAMGKGTSGIMFSTISLMSSLVENMTMAIKTIKEIRQEVSDNTTSEGMKSAIQEIDIMTASLMKSGMSQAEAHAKSVENYKHSINQAIINISDKYGQMTDAEKFQASRKVKIMADELTAIKSHYSETGKIKLEKTKSQLDTEENERKASYDKSVKLLSSKTAKEEAILLDSLRANKINTEEYNIGVSRLLIRQYENELKLAKKFGQDIGEIDKKIADEKMRIKEQSPEKMSRISSPVSVKYDEVSGRDITGNADPSKLKITPPSLDMIKAQETQDQIAKWNTDVNALIQNGLQDAAVSFGEGIGSLMAGDTNIGEFGLGLLGVIGDFMVQFGTLLIAQALASAALLACTSNPLLWPVALAAGIALVAVGTAFSSLSSKGLSGSSGGSSGGSSSGASGYSYAGGSSNINVGGSFELQGSKLIAVIGNTNRKNNNSK